MHLDASPDTSSSDASADASAEANLSPIRSHPFGTLLVDTDHRYWVVSNWPERAEVLAEEQAKPWFDPLSAIPLGAAEATCLHESTTPWQYRDSRWRLVRTAPDETWYIHDTWRSRRRADATILRAWHEDATEAQERSADRDTILSYTDMGLMSLPAGTLVRSESRLYYVNRGQLYVFPNDLLAQQVGYHVERAVAISEADLVRVGWLGEWLALESFETCPMENVTPSPDPLSDHDGDGVPYSRDCDDNNPTVAPGFEELCDGLDNDCDEETDEGFAVNEECVDPREPLSPAVTECADDGRSVICYAYDPDTL
jgi:hypothetical protein